MTNLHCDVLSPSIATSAGEYVGIPERDEVTPAILALQPPFAELLAHIPDRPASPGLALLLLPLAVSPSMLQRFAALGALRRLRPDIAPLVDDYLDGVPDEGIEALKMFALNAVCDLFDALPSGLFDAEEQQHWCARRLELEWLAMMLGLDVSELDAAARDKMVPAYGDALDATGPAARSALLMEFELADMFERPTCYFYNQHE